MENKAENQNFTKTLFIFLQIGIVIFSLGLGYISHSLIQGSGDDLPLIHQAHNILIENTILELPEDVEMQYGMIRGMLDTLNDPNTFLVEPAQHEVQTDQLTGS